MRLPNKKRIKRLPLQPDVDYCEYHPNRMAVTDVHLRGEKLFSICAECKTTLTKDEVHAKAADHGVS